MSKNTVVEHRELNGAYGFKCRQAIVDHHKDGRILITQGWGGNDIDGECYRWRHGLCVQLHPADTFAVLDQDWNDCVSIMEAATNCYDDSRPLLDWPEMGIVKLAQSLGV